MVHIAGGAFVTVAPTLCRAIAADGAAIFEARLDGAAAAAVEADAAGIVEGIGAGGDVDQADRAHAELGRQRAGDQRDGADQAGVQDAAEAGDAVGQHDAVDAELQVGVIVADVEEAARRGILRHAGRLQQHFLDRVLLPCGSASMVSWLFVS